MVSLLFYFLMFLQTVKYEYQVSLLGHENKMPPIRISPSTAREVPLSFCLQANQNLFSLKQSGIFSLW